LLSKITKYNILLGRGFSTSIKKDNSINVEEGSSFLTFKQPTE
jgi:hypothetical protein